MATSKPVEAEQQALMAEERNPKPPSAAWWFFYWAAILTAGAAMLLVRGVAYLNTLTDYVPELIGGALSLLMFPCFAYIIYAGLLMMTRRSLHVRVSRRAALWMFFIGSGIQSGFIFLEITAARTEEHYPKSPPAVLAPTPSAFMFSPTSSDFAVSFPSAPEISEFVVGGLAGHRALWSAPVTASFLRAEAAPLPAGYTATLTREVAFRDLSLAAEQSGLFRPEFHWEIRPSGPVATMRGTKSFSHKGRDIQVTYVTHNYYGPSSVLSLSVGAPAAEYPTSQIVAFLESVRQRRK